MANTTRGIPYPDDYTAAADVPATMQALAATVDTLIGTVDTKATNAGTSAASANTAASNAAAAVAAHTHNGSGSTNIGITAVTGLSTALTGKSDSTHTHSTLYAALSHSHSSAELAAHTHTDYSPTTHTHTQAQSHNSADTDASTSAIHHTIGIGANQAAAGNHTHSGYAASSHTHTGYADSGHTHTGYAIEGHTHTGYAITAHNHDTSYATTTHTHAYAATSHTHSYAATIHGHTSLTLDSVFVSNVSGSVVSGVNGNTAFRVGTDGQVYSYGIAGFTTSNAANVRSGSGAQLIFSTSTLKVKDEITPLAGEIQAVPYLKLSHEDAFVDPYDVLDVSPVEFRSLCPADDNQRLLGFIAEDVAAKFPWAAEYDEYGDPNGVIDRALIAALLCIVKEQQARIQALETAITTP